VLMFAPACTFYGEHPARALSEATGGEGLERVFWKNVQAANWVEVERALASNYAGVTPGGMLDRAATIEQYRQWQVKDYSLGGLKTERDVEVGRNELGHATNRRTPTQGALGSDSHLRQRPRPSPEVSRVSRPKLSPSWAATPQDGHDRDQLGATIGSPAARASLASRSS